MRFKALIGLTFVLMVIFSCNRKKDTQPAEPEPETPVVTNPTEPLCEELPPAPPNFDWTDSTLDCYKNVKAFLVSPLNTDEFICMVEGDISGYNQVFTYNPKTEQKIILGNCGPYLPSINKQGWMVFSTADNNIFRIKINGDSLQQITNNLSSMAPKWDHTGKSIYYFQQATIGSPASSMVKLGIGSSANLYVYPASLPHHAAFNKKDKVLFLKGSNTSVTIVERDMVTQNERNLISGPFEAKNSVVHFNHLCIDNNDEFFYWTNSLGLFRCNLSSLKIDTLAKNCPKFEYINPLFSLQSNELNFSYHTRKAVSNSVLYHEYRPMQMDLNSLTKKELRILQ